MKNKCCFGKNKSMPATISLPDHLSTDNDISFSIKQMLKEKGNTCVSIKNI